MERLSVIPKENVVYVDESGIEQYYQREKARSLRGTKVQDTKRGRKFQRTNIVAGLYSGEVVAPFCYVQKTNHEVFEFWFCKCLLPSIPKSWVIILDNASFHRKNKLLELCYDYDVSLLFLPAYSPDLNPIEKVWANLKHFLRSCLSLFPSIEQCISGFFHHFIS